MLATHALPWTSAVHQGSLGDAGTLLDWSRLEASHCQPAAAALHREPLLSTAVCSFLSPRGQAEPRCSDTCGHRPSLSLWVWDLVGEGPLCFIFCQHNLSSFQAPKKVKTPLYLQKSRAPCGFNQQQANFPQSWPGLPLLTSPGSDCIFQASPCTLTVARVTLSFVFCH